MMHENHYTKPFVAVGLVTKLMSPIENKQIRDTDAQLTEVVYQYAIFGITRSTERFARLDGKATALSSVVGVIITILFSISPKMFSDGNFGRGITACGQVFLIISIVLFFISLGFCIGALWLRSTVDVPLIRDPVVDLKAAKRNVGDEVRLKKKLLRFFTKVDHSFHSQSAAKSRRLQHATVWLIAGFVGLAAMGLSFTVEVLLATHERGRTTGPGDSVSIGCP